jgi:hypothetical protein
MTKSNTIECLTTSKVSMVGFNQEKTMRMRSPVSHPNCRAVKSMIVGYGTTFK